MGPRCEQLLDVLACESLVQRLGVAVDKSGSVVDQFTLCPEEVARKQILKRENERLYDLFETHAQRVDAGLSVRQLNAYLRDREGFLLARRRVGRRIGRCLPGRMQVTDPEYVRLGYHGVLGARVMLVSPVSGLLAADVFPGESVYYVPRGAVEYWSRIAKGRMQFSVQLAKNARVEKLVEAPPSW